MDMLDMAWAMFYWHWLATFPTAFAAAWIGFTRQGAPVTVFALIALTLACIVAIPFVPGAEMHPSSRIVYITLPVFVPMYVVIAYGLGALAAWLRSRRAAA